METIKAEDYGLEVNKANELKEGLVLIQEEKKVLKTEFSRVSKLEITKENEPIFKELRLRIRDNRTKRLNKWKDSQKAYFLAGSNFVQAIYNKEVLENTEMEEKLMNAEKHFENLEKERVAKIQAERVSLLSEFVEDANERDLASMEKDVWEAYLATKKQSHLEKIQDELDAEKERQAKINAEKEEQERIRKENARLKSEAEERERLAKVEADMRAKQEAERKAKEDKERKIREEKERKERAEYEAKLKAEREEKEKIEREEKEKREKLEAKLKAKEEAERKAKEDEEARLQAELNKGDSAKVKDLIADLEALKTKYSFKSSKNVKMYKDVGLLIDKITSHIKN